MKHEYTVAFPSIAGFEELTYRDPDDVFNLIMYMLEGKEDHCIGVVIGMKEKEDE